MESKLVEFRNYDQDTGFYFTDTVEANVWSGDFIMTTGYWVIDETYYYGSSTGKNPTLQQIIINGDVNLIIEDGCSLTMTFDATKKEDKEALKKAITQTVTGALGLAVDGVNTALNKKSSSKSEKTETADSSSTPYQVDKDDVNSIVSGVEGIITAMSNSSGNEGTIVAMISVNNGNSFTLYGQEESTGKLDVEGTVKNSSTAKDCGGAALGSDGNQKTGTITINGCQVSAYSKTCAAAIGSGLDEGNRPNATGGIFINGGDVVATHGSYGGAAIGAAYGCEANGITITAGHVKATAYNDGGAAIGSGEGDPVDNIMISGGYVIATSGNGAGIGTGANLAYNSSNNIAISNGYVYAKGSMGIGATTSKGISGIYINGGEIHAVGKEEGVTFYSAIGAGCAVIEGQKRTVYNYAKDTYISEDVEVTVTDNQGTTTVVEHTGDEDLSEKIAGYTETTCITKHLTYDDIQKDYYEIETGKSNINYYSDIVEVNEEDQSRTITGYTGGAYLYMTDNMSVINSDKVEFSSMYVNGDTAHGGVICADEEGGIINLVDVDFTDNKVIHNSQEAAGGAIYSNGAYETTLALCSFTNNMASGYRLESFGGAIAVTGEGLLTVKDSVFKNNKATTKGGAIYDAHNFTVTGSDFSDGYADKGGAVYAAAGEEDGSDTKRIINSTFTNNTANFGGAVYVEVGAAVSIEDSYFLNNNAHSFNYEIESEYIDYGDHQGGAIYVDGNEDARKGGTVVISNTDFKGNYAKQGAGIYVDSYANVAIKYADFIDNFAEDEGGAIYVAEDGTLSLDDVYFSGNMSYVTGLKEREKEVATTTTTESVSKSDTSESTSHTESTVTKYGTYNEEVLLTKYCAVYNEGDINITGYVEVDPFSLDVLYNRGRVNWDTNGTTANGFFSDITLFTNEVTDGSYIGSFGITVNEDDIEGVSSYVLAEHADFSSMTEETANTLKRFVLRGVDGELDKVITVDGSTVEYNGKTYRLYTTDAEHYNQLILSVEASDTARTSHIVIDYDHFNNAVLNTAGEFKDFKYGVKQGGAVLLTEDAVFSAHDAAFSGNEAKVGGAIYAVKGSKVNLTNVTFSGNVSYEDGKSGAVFIESGATAVMHGDVTLSTASDTITNYGTLVWSISMTDNGYLSDYSLLNNTKYGTLMIANAPRAAYGKYRLADNAKSADGATFVLSDGQSETITVNSEEWVSCGNMEARVYVDKTKKYSLWLEVRATRIDINLETYTMQDDYVVDMTGASAYVGDGGLIYVHSNGRLQNEGSVKITGTYATGNGGAVYSEGNIKLSHAKFIDNHSYGNGGAIYGKGIKITLTDSTFTENAADEGGAIWNLGGTTILNNVTFSGNTAIGNGGAIYGGDIDLRGEVYLSTASDTVWMEEEKTLNWTIDGNDTGYLSDFSLITGNVTAETFTIDAEDASVGHCYVLAGNAETADGQTFTITVTGEDGAEEHTMTVNGETLVVNDISYILGLNDSNELTLSVNQHLVVEDYALLIDSVQDFSWAGMDTYTGNGSIFEIKDSGIMTNVFYDGENDTTYSYAVSFKDGSVGKDDQGNGGNGGIIYNEGSVTLNGASFEANTAEGNGGAVYSSNILYVTDGSFYNNEAENGGAVYIAAGTGNYLSGTFYGNTATELGGALYVASGAALAMGDTTFSSNEADEGGAIYSEGDILLTGELVLSSSDDNFLNKGTVTLDYASGALIRGYQYLMDEDDGKVCISVEGLAEGGEIWQYEFAKGDFSGDYAYVDEFTLTDGTNETTISVGGGIVEFNGLNYSIDVNETGDALLLNAYAPKTLSVTLHDMEKMYDGLELICTDYEISGTLESIDDLIVTFSDSITDAGTKTVDVSDWKVLRDGVDVSYEYSLTSTGCTLTVTPREVTITSGSASKVYDGTALTCDSLTITGDGFADDEGITCTFTGAQKEIGVSNNTFVYTFKDNTKEQNYTITEATGILAVKAVNSAEISIVVDNLSQMYNGRALQATYQYTEGVLAEGDELIVMLDHSSITNTGKVDVTVTDYKVMRGTEDVTDGYRFSQIVSGSIEVTKRNVTLTSASDTKTYDGTALTNETVTVSGDGFVCGEGAAYTFTGSQTEAGSSKNTFTYTLNGNTLAENYNILQEYGTLIVTPSGEDLLTTIAGNFNGTGSAFQLYSNGQGVIRTADSFENLGGTLENVENWQIVGTGDFSGRGTDGLLWQDLTTGELVMQNDMSSFAEVNGKTNVLGVVGEGYTAKATGDFSGTGMAGALIQTPETGKITTSTTRGLACFARSSSGDMFVGWLGALVNTWDDGVALKGDLTSSSSINSSNYRYEVVAVGDFNGDGRDDVMLQNTMPEVVTEKGVDYTITGSGDVFTFLTGDELAIRKGSAPTVCYAGRATDGWEVVGIGDFNSDGIDDTLLRNGTDLAAWGMEDGRRQTSFGLGSLTSDEEFAGIADFNNDGTDDLLIRTISTGDLNAWTIENGKVTGTLAIV